MTAPHGDQLIEGYLARLRAAAANLPAATRDELLNDVRTHIGEARSREAEETDASILNMLDRLGDPAEVVTETRERLSIRPQPTQRPGIVEIAALVLLPFLWVAGVVLLWWSPCWKVRDKVIGTVCSLGGYPFVGVVAIWAAHGAAALTGGGPCGSNASSWCNPPAALDALGHLFEFVIPVALLSLPVATAIYLVIRLRERSSQYLALA